LAFFEAIFQASFINTMNNKHRFAVIPALLLAFGLCAQTFTTPPSSPVRTMAEWEELQALVITWNPGNNPALRNILAEITRAAREECTVIIVGSAQNVSSAKTFLDQQDVDTSSNVEFLTAPNNSIWVRDYGPNCVYANNVDSLLLVDWIYNRNRLQDNTVPEKIGQFMQLPVYGTTQAPYDLVNTGGNFMTDGMGTAFASTLVLINNDQIENGECGIDDDVFGTSNHTESSIDNIMQEYMGIDRYIKLEPLPFDCIHHIDMHIKLLDEQTLLVGEYPPGVADGPQIEENLQYIFSNYQTVFGTPYKIVRIPMPPEGGQYPNQNADYRTYTNAVFVNKTIIVPFYEEAYDTIAKRIWQEAMPGYKIVGVNCNDIIPYSGAVHCITKEIGVHDPLRIVHKPLETFAQNAVNPPNYPVSALIEHRSGIAQANVYYRQKTATTWESAPLSKFPDSLNLFVGAIPRQEHYYDTLYYYIGAEANNGKTQVRPLTSPEGAWSFKIELDISNTSTPGAIVQEIYPNPVSDVAVIPVETKEKMSCKILMYNALGQMVGELFSGELPAGKSKHLLHAAPYQPGVYFITVQRDGMVIASKKVAIR